MKIFSLVIFIFLLSNGNEPEKTINPENYFDSQYTDAIAFCHSKKDIVLTSLSDCAIPANMAMSIVFPEMLRYSFWKDILETKALEILYISMGKEAADFSIGWMQMKPSFAEMVELHLTKDTLLLNKYSELISDNKNLESETVRKERIRRLQQFEWQLKYLGAFTDLNVKKLRSAGIPFEEMLPYLAAAYNKGMDCEPEELKKFANTRTFPYGPGRNNPFSYVKLSEYFYQFESKQIYTY